MVSLVSPTAACYQPDYGTHSEFRPSAIAIVTRRLRPETAYKQTIASVDSLVSSRRHPGLMALRRLYDTDTSSREQCLTSLLLAVPEPLAVC
jgi:hypothetical protein